MESKCDTLGTNAGKTGGKTMSEKNRARIRMAFSAAIFGTIPLFVRNISLASGEVALYRAVIATILIGGCLLFTRAKVPLTALRKELPLLLLSGF